MSTVQKILFTKHARQDLLETYEFIRDTDSLRAAKRVMKKIETACLSLSENPERGHVPKELRAIDVTGWLEIIVSPWRIIYIIREDALHIIGILDGRRDIPAILMGRLLR